MTATVALHTCARGWPAAAKARRHCSAYIADADADCAVLVEAEGVFTMPRWLRTYTLAV